MTKRNRILPLITLLLLGAVASQISAQTRSKDEVLVNSAGSIISLSTPSLLTSYKLILPGSAGPIGSILYISALGGTTDTASWLGAGSDGQVLGLVGGIPTWTTPSSFAGWALSGNSGTTAWNGSTGNFLGTTDAQPLVIATTNTSVAQPIEFLTNNTERARISDAGNVGIGTTAPNTMLDVRKDFAMRVDTLFITAGVQNDVAINASSNLRTEYSGTPGRDTITGFAGGYDGKVLHIVNTVEGVMTLSHNSTLSSAANRIYTIDNKDLSIGDTGSVDMVYDSKMSRWLVKGATRQIAGAAAQGLSFFSMKSTPDTVFASTTLVNDKDLQILHVEAYQVLDIEGMLYVNSNVNNGDFNMALDVPNDYDYFKVAAIAVLTSGTSVEADMMSQDNVRGADLNVIATQTTLIHLSGIYVNGPTDGDIIFRWSQDVASGWTSISKGSYLIGHKLR